jgi:nucleoside-diphosphate-sugar epimerase
MGQTACVTGSRGFIGNHLVRTLIDRGWRVKRLLRQGSGNNSGEASSASGETESIWISNDGLPDLREALEGATVFFHLAGVIRGRRERDFRSGNVDFTRRIASSVVRDKGPEFLRFMHLSSLAAAGPSSDGTPIDENTDPHPVGWYGISKFEAERAVLEYAGEMPVTILRPCAVYGPNDTAFLPLFRFMSMGPAICPEKDFSVSLIHVEDLVDAIILGAEAATSSGSQYFVSGESSIRHSELCRTIAAFHGRTPLQIPVPAPAFRLAAYLSEMACLGRNIVPVFNRQKAAEICAGHWVCDPSRAKQDFGFVPRWEIRDGLRATHDWYVRNGWL